MFFEDYVKVLMAQWKLGTQLDKQAVLESLTISPLTHQINTQKQIKNLASMESKQHTSNHEKYDEYIREIPDKMADENNAITYEFEVKQSEFSVKRERQSVYQVNESVAFFDFVQQRQKDMGHHEMTAVFNTEIAPILLHALACARWGHGSDDPWTHRIYAKSVITGKSPLDYSRLHVTQSLVEMMGRQECWYRQDDLLANQETLKNFDDGKYRDLVTTVEKIKIQWSKYCHLKGDIPIGAPMLSEAMEHDIKILLGETPQGRLGFKSEYAFNAWLKKAQKCLRIGIKVAVLNIEKGQNKIVLKKSERETIEHNTAAFAIKGQSVQYRMGSIAFNLIPIVWVIESVRALVSLYRGQPITLLMPIKSSPVQNYLHDLSVENQNFLSVQGGGAGPSSTLQNSEVPVLVDEAYTIISNLNLPENDDNASMQDTSSSSKSTPSKNNE